MATIGLFKKPRIIRKYGKQEIRNGLAASSFSDTTLKLDVQMLRPDELMSLPEGERTMKRVKTYGVGKLTAADEFNGVRGDMLWYRDQWYECVSSVLLENTILKHYRSEFVLVPFSKQPIPPIMQEEKSPEPEETLPEEPDEELPVEEEPEDEHESQDSEG